MYNFFPLSSNFDFNGPLFFKANTQRCCILLYLFYYHGLSVANRFIISYFRQLLWSSKSLGHISMQFSFNFSPIIRLLIIFESMRIRFMEPFIFTFQRNKFLLYIIISLVLFSQVFLIHLAHLRISISCAIKVLSNLFVST